MIFLSLTNTLRYLTSHETPMPVIIYKTCLFILQLVLHCTGNKTKLHLYSDCSGDQDYHWTWLRNKFLLLTLVYTLNFISLLVLTFPPPLLSNLKWPDLVLTIHAEWGLIWILTSIFLSEPMHKLSTVDYITHAQLYIKLFLHMHVICLNIQYI